jgi:GNAT superfamily N-acetyltransferase
MIREATVADSAQLMRLVVACVAEMQAHGIEQWDEVYPGLAEIERDTLAGTLHILMHDEQLVGCITLDHRLDPLWSNLDWTPGSEPALAVHRLMIQPQFQGRGLAKQLMLHAEEVAKGLLCRSLRLDTFVANPIAMALYPKLGYRPTGSAMMRKGAFMGFEKLI